MINKFYSRKFFLVIGTYLSTVALLLLGKIDGSMYVTVTLGIVGAFVTADIFEKKVAKHDVEN